MSYACTASFKLTWRGALLMAALPMACAVGVQEPGEGNSSETAGSGGSSDTAGSSSGGMVAEAGKGGSLPQAGTAPTGGRPNNPFGGTSSSGGKGGSGGSKASGGSASGGTGFGGRASGGTGFGGRASGGSGTGGKASGGTSSGGTGGGGSSCGCTKTVTWVDNTNVTWGPGDCVKVMSAVYLYTGTAVQTYANKDCNPTSQLSWCTGSGYKFMLCP